MAMSLHESSRYYIINCHTNRCLAKYVDGDGVFLDGGRIGRSLQQSWKIVPQKSDGAIILQNVGAVWLPHPTVLNAYISKPSLQGYPCTLNCVSPSEKFSYLGFDLSTSWAITPVEGSKDCFFLHTEPGHERQFACLPNGYCPGPLCSHPMGYLADMREHPVIIKSKSNPLHHLSLCWKIIPATTESPESPLFCRDLKLPTELWYYIIATIAQQFYHDNTWQYPATLKNCALVCEFFYKETLQYLYRGAKLVGDHRTKTLVNTLKSRLDLLERFVSITNAVTKDGSRFYLAPMALFGLPSPPLALQTISLASQVTGAHAPLGRNTHDVFLKSYTALGDKCSPLLSLALSHISFDTFSYFARLLLSIRSLRHLSLDNIKIDELNNYPTSIAKRKGLSLLSFASCGVTGQAWLKAIDWLGDSKAFNATERISLEVICGGEEEDLSPPKANTTISSMLHAAGSSLNTLELTWRKYREFKSDDPGVNLNLNNRIESVKIRGCPLQHLTSTLASLSPHATLSTLIFESTLDDYTEAVVETLASIESSVLQNASIHFCHSSSKDQYQSEHCVLPGDKRHPVAIRDSRGGKHSQTHPSLALPRPPTSSSSQDPGRSNVVANELISSSLSNKICATRDSFVAIRKVPTSFLRNYRRRLPPHNFFTLFCVDLLEQNRRLNKTEQGPVLKTSWNRWCALSHGEKKIWLDLAKKAKAEHQEGISNRDSTLIHGKHWWLVDKAAQVGARVLDIHFQRYIEPAIWPANDTSAFK